MDERIEEIQKIKSRIGFMTKNYLASKDQFFPYWRYRVARPLLKLKYKNFRRKGDLPWLSPTSIEFFKGYLNDSHVGCEFGSGASTMFFAKMVKHFVSIEHYRPWFESVQEKLTLNNVLNVDYLFVEKQEPTSTVSGAEMFPDVKGIESYDYRKDFINYFSALDSYDDESFDFIIVDGRARPECVFASLSKLKPNGLMILDNSERDRYNIVFDNLSHWEMIETTNGLTNTTFWVKPRK
ncbi:MAG: hypothetical protein Crog4KO_02550 [Crocinitomicaceae bacterium]